MNDKYLHFQLNDFLEDPDFIQSVNSGEIKNEIWLDWLNVHPDQSKIIDQAVMIIGKTQFEKHQLTKHQKDKLWNNIDGSTFKTNKIRNLSPNVKSFAIAGIAASILLLIYVGIGFVFPYTTVSTVRSEQVNYEFPDRSSILLNAASGFSFKKSGWKNNRRVLLEGEAFFEVVKGSEFIVESALGQVKVLGTSFTVLSRDSKFEVKCRTGKVLVTTMNNDSIYLSPGQGTSFNKKEGNITAIYFDPQIINDWTVGVFEYEGESADIIFTALERQFDVNFIKETDFNTSQIIYTGSFRNTDLEKALNDVLWPMHLKYRIEGKSVFISQND